MKTLASRSALILLAIALAMAPNAQAAGCKPGSTSGKCLLPLITALQAQVATLQAALNAQNAKNAIALGQFVSVQQGTIKGLAGPHVIFRAPTSISGAGPAPRWTRPGWETCWSAMTKTISAP